MNKTLISLFAVVALVLSLVAVSALTLSTPSDLTLANNKTTLTLTSADPVNLTITKTDSTGVSTSLSSTPASPFSGSAVLNISLDSVASTVKFGEHTTTISVLSVNSSNSAINETKTASFNFVKSFCSRGAIGTANLSISSIDISNQGQGDDTEWHLLDTVIVKVEVENNGDSDLNDVFVELGLFDSAGNDVTGDLDFVNTDEKKIEVGKLNDGDSEEVTFEFRISPDFEDDDYSFAVKTYSKKVGQDNMCDDTSGDLDDNFFQTVNIQKESDEGKRIGFDNIKFSPTEATCGDTVGLTFDAINIGDQDEDQVKITLKNSDFNINQFVELKGGLDMGDSEEVSFTFEVPAGLSDKTYSLAISAEYDYNKGDYRQELDEDTTAQIKVLGCQPTSTTSGASITASLASEAKAGQTMTVLSTIKNTGSSAASFVVDATGYSDWATLGSISDRIVTLNAGESKDVTVTLNVNKAASGDKSFILEARNGAQTASKTVSVSLASVEGVTLGGNTMLWVIGAINLVLVIVIIIVAIRVSRR